MQAITHRIGYDAKRLFNNFTGLGNYSRTLLRNLARYYPEEEYFLYTPDVKRVARTQFFLDSPMFSVRMPKKGQRLLWRTWRQVKDVQRDEIELYHGLSHELPLNIQKLGIPTIVTMHDLIFRHYPAHYPWFDRQVYDRKFRRACEVSDKVIAISESTKRDLVESYGTPEEKIEVIYQSCHEGFMVQKTPAMRAAVVEKYNLPTDYMLYVGSLIARKNLLGIVQAMAKVKPDLRLPLVIIGDGEAYRKIVEKEAQQLGIQRLLIFISPVFSDFPALYQQARLFLYPSYYEGFGIPILEALFSEVPVLTSNCSSLPEAAGPGGYLVAPADTDEMAHGIERLLTDEDLRQELIQAGYAHAQKFQGEQLTGQLVRVYRNLLGV